MAAASSGAGLLYVCNPNNPTSTVQGAQPINDCVARVLRDTPTETILIDEAYHEYVDDPTYSTAVPLAMANPRVIVARTFSKVHGLAGLRVGYAIARPETIAVLRPWVLPVSVNQLGAAAALASIGVQARIDRERARNREAREFTRKVFADAGYPSVVSDANFIMVDVRRPSTRFAEGCKANGVLVGRPFPPLTNYARISIGTMDEMHQASDVFRRVLATA
jgi:histidinol-phosphate aminotransferase